MLGRPETTTGGRSLQLYAGVRLDVRRIAQIKEREETVGSRVRVKVVKNKISPPFKQAEFDILWGEGISSEGDILDLAIEEKLIHQGGAGRAIDGQDLRQGPTHTRQSLKDRPGICDQRREGILERKNVHWTLGAAREAPVDEQHSDDT